MQPPIWSASPYTDSTGGVFYSVSSAGGAADSQLSPRFSPTPFGSGAPSFTLTLSDRWNHVTSDAWLAAFNPDRRWDNVYQCKQ